jgi:hypothetical protein
VATEFGASTSDGFSASQQGQQLVSQFRAWDTNSPATPLSSRTDAAFMHVAVEDPSSPYGNTWQDGFGFTKPKDFSGAFAVKPVFCAFRKAFGGFGNCPATLNVADPLPGPSGETGPPPKPTTPGRPAEPTPIPGPQRRPMPPRQALRVQTAQRRLRSSRRRVSVPVRCMAARGSCKVAVRLSSSTGHRRTAVGKARVRLSTAGKRLISVRLSRKARSRLRHGRLRVVLSVVASDSSAARATVRRRLTILVRAR